MQYRTMPKNGDRLSALGFGCMRLPIKDQKIDESKAIRLIHDAIARGVNYFDTAWPYHAGESEVLLGKALSGGCRDRVKVATKLPSWMIKTRADMDRYLAAQLAKLGTDRIDYYLLHALDGTAWDKLFNLGVLEFLERAKADGRIVNVGFSFHGLSPDFMRIVDAYPWCFCQVQYNYLDRQNQAGTQGVQYAAAKGLGVIVMEPLHGGNLALPTPPPAIGALWNKANIRRTPAEWALHWVWNHPEVTVVLSGMNADSQLEENQAIANRALPGTLSHAELELVEEVGRCYRQWMKVDCTGCGYCMPCPNHVSIPLCFEEYNQRHLFATPVEEVKFRYALRTSGELVDGRPGFASQCVPCGECLDKCPQHLPIPDLLKQVAAELEDAQISERLVVARKLFKREAP
jgi:uncharacterized protein